MPEKDFRFESPELLNKSHYNLGREKPVIFRCIDSRQDRAFDAWLAAHDWFHKDYFIVPGGARMFVTTNSGELPLRQAWFEWCRFVYSAHGARWFIITGHSHCGDYARSVGAFPDDQTEEARVTSDLAKARKDLQEELGRGVTVEACYVDGRGIHPVA